MLVIYLFSPPIYPRPPFQLTIVASLLPFPPSAHLHLPHPRRLPLFNERSELRPLPPQILQLRRHDPRRLHNPRRSELNLRVRDIYLLPPLPHGVEDSRGDQPGFDRESGQEDRMDHRHWQRVLPGPCDIGDKVRRAERLSKARPRRQTKRSIYTNKHI